MYNALADVFNEAAKDDDVSVVIWDAAGDSFSAGNDIEDFLKNPPGPGESPQARLGEALLNLDKPVIAAVKGVAIGGGTTLLTHCDFVYAGESSKFKLPFVDLGLVPEFGSSWSLPARSGYIRAAELFLLAQPFSAEVAREIGLVTRVVPDTELSVTVTQTAEKLASKPIGALQATKKLLKRSSREVIDQAIQAEVEEFSSRVRSAEVREVFTAFMEKRKPDFAKAKEAATAR
jgi:enoyl-CoA hydratase/carnithine racemase